MPRPIQAFIYIDALKHNLQQARHAAPGASVWAVVKANAYGHGIEHVFEGLQSADGFALLDIAEAQRIRQLGWRGPILLLEGAFDARDLEWCSRLNLWHTIHHEAQIDWLAVHKTQWPHRIFLKLNSGMNRLGFDPNAFRHAWLRLSAMQQVEEITLMSHFADAEGPHGIGLQHALFMQTCSDLPGERSLCNSAASLLNGNDASVRNDWIRPGIMLYGSSPDYPKHNASHWGLLPAMTLRSQLIAIQHIQAGDSVGYGYRFTAKQPMRIGVVACGYADGYPRHAPDGTPVLVDGVRTHITGRVAMDMLMLDLSNAPNARIGSEVTLWGRGPQSDTTDASDILSIDEVAHHCGTVGYELMCAVSQRVSFEVKQSE